MTDNTAQDCRLIKKLYTPSQIAFASFVGGLAASVYFLVANLACLVKRSINTKPLMAGATDEKLTPDNENLVDQSVKGGMKRNRGSLREKVRSKAVHVIDYIITTIKYATPEAKESAMQGLRLSGRKTWQREHHNSLKTP